MMNDELIKIRQLQALAELKLNTERARLKDILREEEGPKAVLDAIAQEKKSQSAVSEQEVSQSLLAGAQGKWQVWADREARAAMSELARIAQKYEHQLQITTQAFGRTEALKSIEAKTKAALQR